MNYFEEEFSRSPESLTFNALECCALTTAFTKNSETVHQLENLLNRRSLGIMKDELRDTDNLVLIADPITKAVYTQLAEAELKRLAQQTHGLSCGHSGEEHERALRSVKTICAEPIN